MTALDDLCAVPFHDADVRLRARILSRFADTELSVCLVEEPTGDVAAFRTFDLPGGHRVALAFDRDERLSQFLGGPAPYLALPGRALAQVLTGQETGLLVNPGLPSEMLLEVSTLAWLSDVLSSQPQETVAQARVGAPDPTVVAVLAQPLADRLGDLRGFVSGAALVGAGGTTRSTAAHLLLIAGAPIDAQPRLAKSLADTLALLPDVSGGVDIAFTEAAVPDTALRFDLSMPKPDVAVRPKGPPILR